MSRRTQSLALLLFGGALLRLATGTGLLEYVRPSARPWILLASAAIVLLAGCNLLAGGRPIDESPQTDEHSHPGAPRVGWLVLAPVLAILVIAPPALGAFSAARVPAAVARPANDQFPALAAGDPVSVSLIDFATRAIWDDGRTLLGRRVRLTGFVLRAREGGFVLSRLVITCCAADARPINIAITGIATTTLAPAPNSWVAVTGVYAGTVRAGRTALAEVKASAVVRIGQPSNPYDD